MASQDFIERCLLPQDLPGRDLDVGGLTLRTAQRLVHVNGGMRQRITTALGAGRQEHRPE